MPGVDPGEAMRVVTGELDAFPHLIELPAAGVGADMVGRGAAHLVGLHVDVQPSGWRFAAHEGGDERRARGMLARDLDVLEEHTQGYVGPLKLQVAGPWTLASSLELHYGDKALADVGAVRDITEALAEGIADVAEDVANRVPGAAIVVQFDEPLIAAVLLGRVPTASGFGTLRIVEPPMVIERLRGRGRCSHWGWRDTHRALLRRFATRRSARRSGHARGQPRCDDSHRAGRR